MADTARITKAYAEVVSDTTPPAKITKVYAEVVNDTSYPAKITKAYLEVVTDTSPTVACRWSLMGVGQR